MSTKDVIKKSVRDYFEKTMTIETMTQIIVSLLISLLMGLVIYFVYKKSFRGVVYSQTFAMTLVGMSVLTCMVVLAISTNIVLSLGMVGALSIVRYRTAIKEPLDLLFIFWAITTGITVGAGMYLLSAASAVVIILLVLLLGGKGKVKKVYIMIVHYKGDETEDEIRKILFKIKHNVKSKTMRKEETEMAVEVYAKQDNLAFAGQIRDIENVLDLTLVQYDGEYHG